MTLTWPPGVESVVVIERHDNVVHIDFLRPGPPPPGPGLEENSPLQPPSPRAAAAGPLPARWSPRPVRAAGRRFARSQLAADLVDYGWLIALFLGALLGALLLDHLHHIAPTTTGGIR